jgi:hypothetical protein
LTEGSRYELSVDHENGSSTFYSKVYDLTTNAPIRNDKVQVTLKPIEAGDEIELEGIQFKSYSSILDNPDSELRRAARLIKNTPSLAFELQVILSGYLEDSVQSIQDLTEVETDTATVSIEAIDSLGQMITKDSTIVRQSFHNNRTEQQAVNIIDQLVLLGVDKNRLSTFVNAKPLEAGEVARIRVRLVARAM